MLDLTKTFTALGAFVRADRALTNIADFDLNLLVGETRIRSLPNLQATLQSLDDDVLAQAAGRDAATQLGWSADQCRAARQSLRTRAEAWLLRLAKSELRAVATIGEAIAALADEMRDQSASIDANDLSIESITAGDGNVGTTGVYATMMQLDDIDLVAESQLVGNGFFELRCTRDSRALTTSRGDEYWQALGADGKARNLRTIPRTSGPSEHARNLVIDGCFADWDGDLPRHWASGGTLALIRKEETLTRFGELSLAIDGVGAATVSQALNERSTPLVGGQMMCLAASVYVHEILAGELAIRVRLNGSPLFDEITLDDATLADEWLEVQALIGVTRLLAADILEVEIDTSIDFEGTVYLDGLAFGAYTPIGGGVSVAIIEGVDEPISGDHFTFATNSDEASPFGVYLRDAFGAELPSDPSPTIAASLAD